MMSAPPPYEYPSQYQCSSKPGDKDLLTITFPGNNGDSVKGGGAVYAWGTKANKNILINLPPCQNASTCGNGTLTLAPGPIPPGGTTTADQVWAVRIDGLTVGTPVTLIINYTDVTDPSNPKAYQTTRNFTPIA
jgi:hypothetical protein